MKPTLLFPFCLLVGALTALPAAAQTPDDAHPPSLPLVTDITNKEGKTIQNVKIISKDDNGITIVYNGVESYLKYEKLSDETEKALENIRNQPAPVVPPARITRADVIMKMKQEEIRMKASQNAYKSIAEKKLSPKELKELFLQKDPELLLSMESAQIVKNREAAQWKALGDTEYDKYATSGILQIPNIEIKDSGEKEVVSLRTEFIELGVKINQQEGDTCATNSMYNALQYLLLKNGKNPPSIGQLIATAKPMNRFRTADSKLDPNNIPPQYLTQAIAQITGQRPMTMMFDVGEKKLTKELIKHELRKGHLVVSRLGHKTLKVGHAVVIIGFKSDGNKTSFEYIDSNLLNTDNNSGYTQEGNENAGWIGNPYFSIWYE